MVQFLVQNIESQVGNKTLQQWKDAVTPNFFVSLSWPSSSSSRWTCQVLRFFPRFHESATKIKVVEVQNLKEMWNKKLCCHRVTFLEESTQAALENCWVQLAASQHSLLRACGGKIIAGFARRDLQNLWRFRENLCYNALAPAVRNQQECSEVCSMLRFTCL